MRNHDPFFHPSSLVNLIAGRDSEVLFFILRLFINDVLCFWIKEMKFINIHRKF